LVYEAQQDCLPDWDARISETRTRIETMLRDRGFSKTSVFREGADRIRVEVADTQDFQEINRLIGYPARIEFVAESGNIILTGEHVTSVTAGWDTGSGGHAVFLQFNAEGTRRFAEATGPQFIGQTLSIVTITGVGDTEERTIVSAPEIRSTITNGRAVISDMANMETAQSLANQIIAGQFGVQLRLLEADIIGG
jgi:preprotein translocase subunit SecD